MRLPHFIRIIAIWWNILHRVESCTIEGAEILHMSNPGDYDADDYECEYEIIEIDED